MSSTLKADDHTLSIDEMEEYVNGDKDLVQEHVKPDAKGVRKPTMKKERRDISPS